MSLTSVSASEVVIGDVADKFKVPCQRVHAVTVTVCRRPESNRRWLTPAISGVGGVGGFLAELLPQINSRPHILLFICVSLSGLISSFSYHILNCRTSYIVCQ